MTAIKEIIFLGTGGVMPTLKRNTVSLVVKINGDVLLFDCGEGCQKELLRSKVGIGKIKAIFITHMHGDHLLGLPGLLMTLNLCKRERDLDIFGPLGLTDYIVNTFKAMHTSLDYEVKIHEIPLFFYISKFYESKVIMNERKYRVLVLPVKHVIDSLAYIVQDKETKGHLNTNKASKEKIPRGPLLRMLKQDKIIRIHNKIVLPEDVIDEFEENMSVLYSGDTSPRVQILIYSSHIDFLIHETTFSISEYNIGHLSGHSTFFHVDEMANFSHVKNLIAIHFSPRYGEENIKKEFKAYKGNIVIPKDHEKLIITF